MLELKNISASYGKSRIIDSLSLDIPKGRIVSVIGVNGSGKSTLLKATAGIIPIEKGEIEIDGKSTSDMTDKETAEKIAYLAQGKSIPDITVSRLVLHGRFPHLSYPRVYSEIDRKKAEEAMRKTKVIHLADTPVSALSGGMRQSAYIAMALAQDTDYLLLDEPTTYLDISCQTQLMGMLCTLADEGKGILAVMHDLPLAFSLSDIVAVMDKGKLLAVDTPEAVFESGIIKKLFGVSMEYFPEYDSYSYRYTFPRNKKRQI